MHLNSSSTRLLPRALARASLRRRLQLNTLRFHPLSCSEASVPPLPRSCLCWTRCCGAEHEGSFSQHQPVLDLAPSSGTLAPVTRHSCCSVTPLLLSVLVQTAQRRVRSLLANIPIARTCGRSCAPPSPVRRRLVRATPSFFLYVVPTCFCRRRRSTATAKGTTFFLSRRPCRQNVLPTSLALARDAMSSSSWILSFAPSAQQLLVH